MPQIDVVDTSWSDPQIFAQDVVAAFMRQGLSAPSAYLLTAHVALSTGWGKKCHNWSLAGIKATESQDYVVLTGFENEGGTNVYSSMKWRAFATLDEGAAAVIGLLQQDRYASAWQMLQAGDVNYFEEVGRNGWYTADPVSTAAEMRGRLQQIQSWLGEPSEQGGGLIPLLTIGGLLWWWVKK